MANWQWGHLFWVPSAVTATTAATGYAAVRAGTVDKHPLQHSWRSTATTQQDVIVDYGVSRALVAVALLHVNATTIQVATSPDNITYTSMTGSPYTMARDMDGFYKRMITQTISTRYLRVRFPAQTPIGGASYFELGLVLGIAALTTFIQNPEPDLVQTLSRPYLKSGNEMPAPVGFPRLTEELQLVSQISQSSQFREMALLGQHVPLVVYKNTGVLYDVGMYRFENDIQARMGGTTLTVNPRLQEMV